MCHRRQFDHPPPPKKNKTKPEPKLSIPSLAANRAGNAHLHAMLVQLWEELSLNSRRPFSHFRSDTLGPINASTNEIFSDVIFGAPLRAASSTGVLHNIRVLNVKAQDSCLKQVRLVSAKAERPNHPSLGGGGQPARERVSRLGGSQPEGVLHDDTNTTP